MLTSGLERETPVIAEKSCSLAQWDPESYISFDLKNIHFFETKLDVVDHEFYLISPSELLFLSGKGVN